METDLSKFVLPNKQPVVSLDCTVAFKNLTNNEKLYAHYLSRAAWYGGLIVFFQTSPESPLIFLLLHRLYRSQTLDELSTLATGECDLTADEVQALLVYSSGILTNCGNYKGFGDSKIVPGLPIEKLERLVKASKAYKDDPSGINFLWDNCSKAMYSLEDQMKQLGLGNKGITTYFSSNCDTKDASLVKLFLKDQNMDAYNSRVFKTVQETGVHYEARLASSQCGDLSNITKSGIVFEDATFSITRGDYGKLLGKVVSSLSKAKDFASNDTEVKMLDHYINSFQSGSLDAHKDGSRMWIQDKGPVIETYIGFIETYRDPAGMRGEFEGFVAMVNKKMSAKFGTLVEKAEGILEELPWPSTYEKDKFLKPDFTSLDVLTFSGSGIPAGINIPNYDEIRQNEGFKNVSLGNVIPASYKDTKLPFLSAEDRALLEKYRVQAFEVQVGLHELLGHGSGKLFRRNKDRSLNFDVAAVQDTETGKEIALWYEEGETYDSKFTSISSAYEECRAECVGLYLSLNKDILRIFGHEGEVADDIMYTNWLSLLWNGGSKALEMFQPETKTWLQAHSQARYVILRVLLEAGEGLLTVEKTKDSDGADDLLITLDRSKMSSVGKEAIGSFLRKLQVYKSTADVAAAESMFGGYSEVPEDGTYPFAEWIPIILAKKQPRKMMVQANTKFDGEMVELLTYESSHAGLIKSFVERYQDKDLDTIIIDLWKKDQQSFVM